VHSLQFRLKHYCIYTSSTQQTNNPFLCLVANSSMASAARVSLFWDFIIPSYPNLFLKYRVNRIHGYKRLNWCGLSFRFLLIQATPDQVLFAYPLAIRCWVKPYYVHAFSIFTAARLAPLPRCANITLPLAASWPANDQVHPWVGIESMKTIALNAMS